MLSNLPKNLLFILATLVGLLVTSFVFVSYAKEIPDSIESAIKNVKQNVDTLVSIKDNAGLTEEEKETKKFEAAKDALLSVIELGLTEISAFKEKLSEQKIEKLSASDYTFDAEEIHGNLKKMVEYYEAYHQDMLKRVELLEDYKDAQGLAKDIKNWREKIYRPGIKKILSLELTLKNKEIIKVANNRFDKILADLRKLKNAKLITLSSVEPLLDNITGNKKAIIALDEEITAIILKILKTPTATLEASDKLSSEKVLISDHQLISNLVEQSFLKVKDMYRAFIEINSLVKKMIGVE